MNDGAERRPELLWATQEYSSDAVPTRSWRRGLTPARACWEIRAMHRWKTGDEVWARFYELETDRYVARLYGRVIGVGPKGFAVRLVNPAPKQPSTVRYPHSATLWPTREAAEMAIAERPSPETPGTPRNLRGGGS